jgi:hypothetical protein
LVKIAPAAGVRGTAKLPPERMREILANNKYIAERALMGERSAETLRDGTLDF